LCAGFAPAAHLKKSLPDLEVPAFVAGKDGVPGIRGGLDEKQLPHRAGIHCLPEPVAERMVERGVVQKRLFVLPDQCMSAPGRFQHTDQPGLLQDQEIVGGCLVAET